MSGVGKFFVENGGNTCYIDSLLMALFFNPSHIDGVLNKKLSKEQYSYIQDYILHMFVNKVRDNCSVSADTINEMRVILTTNGWNDFDSIFEQQDVNEFFSFLADKFEITPIEFEKRIFVDKNESKVIKEKLHFIPLSLPSDSSTIKVPDMLKEWMHYNEVDIKREIDNEIKDVKGLTTFNISNIPEFMVLSINRFTNLKERNSSDVIITKTLKPFANTTNNDIKDIEWSFQSAVCHRGASPYSGHYYSLLFTKRDSEDVWFIFDDLKTPCMEEVSMSDKDVITKIKKDCVLLIYQLKF